MADAPDLLPGVLAAIHANRTPGWNFAGHYLALEYLKVHERLTVLSCPSRPELLDRDGGLDISVLAVLCDLVLASSARPRVGPGTRMATVTMSVFLHAAMGAEGLVARSRLLSYETSSGLVTATGDVRCGGRLQATATASFLAMTGITLAPVPVRGGSAPPPADLAAAMDLTAPEQAVMDRARAAAEGGTVGFLSRFWSCRFDQTPQGAEGVFEIGLQAGNRVGHVQGGLLFAFAAAGGQAAAGDGYRIAAVHANYSRPGRSPSIRIRATRVHRGSTTASTTVTILDEEETTLLSALVEFVRAERA